MNNEEKQFKRHLEEYWQSKGIQNVKVPQIGGRDLDFYLLYKSVTKRGGAQQVSMNKLWKEVVNEFGLPPSCTSASFTLRNHYSRYLLAYEQKFFFGKNDSQAIKELQGSRIRKIVKMNDEDQEQIRQEVMINQGISNTINEYGNENQNQPQLKQVLMERYQNKKQQEEIFYVKKNKTVPFQSEIKRIILAFESKIVGEVTYALNCLLLYSCNNIQPFILDQYPALLDQVVRYWTLLLKNQNVSFKSQEEQSIFINYQVIGDIIQLEQSRIISQILRNLSLIKINQIAMNKNKKFLLIIQKIILYSNDTDSRKCCFETFASISRHLQVEDILEFDKIFDQLLININPIKNPEIIESCLVSIKFLMMNQENISYIEGQLLKKLQDISYLLLHKNIDIRELTLEILCFLSDQKMTTRLAIAKQPKMVQRLVATMCQFSNKNSERFVKLANHIIQNINLQNTCKQYLQPFELEFFLISISDELLSESVSNLIYDETEIQDSE